MIYHPDIEVAAGVPWTLDGVLYDATGAKFDVTNCAFVWALLDPDAVPVVPVNANVSIAKTDPVNGGIQITIPSTFTDLPPGRYTDVLEVTEGASTDTFWIGNILIAANPFTIWEKRS